MAGGRGRVDGSCGLLGRAVGASGLADSEPDGAGDDVAGVAGPRGRGVSERSVPGHRNTATATTTAAVTAPARTGSVQRRSRALRDIAPVRASSAPAAWNRRTSAGSAWISSAPRR
ncbi:hypothetical protein ACFQHO_14390 [Actinomadura yumaensis]|uniref:hypothetical protein n=1 Tax=Actinomadura yumaensis TaxID=111807 RepID=UPI0036170EFE